MQEFLARYMPIDGSAHGPRLDFINALVHWLMLVLFVGWGLYFLYVLYRFRAKKHPQASYTGAQTHVSTWVEGLIVVAEIVLLVGFSIPAWSRWVSIPGSEENALEVRIIAEQFAWNIQYTGPDGKFGRTLPHLMEAGVNPLGLDPTDANGKDDVISLNQLHLPVNRPVIIHLGAKDVIHSFALNNMRVKQDAIPGMEVNVHFTPVKVSKGHTWEIACAQLCGLGHYRMRGSFVVETPEEFQAWLVANAPQPLTGN